VFDALPGVLSSWVGYTGGDADGDPHAPPPTYDSVCSRRNTHTEALRLEFDPEALSYRELARRVVAHPRVQRVRGRDGANGLRRAQTRVAVWARDAVQMRIAREVLAEAGKAGVVPVLPPSAWHEADALHQHFIKEDKAFPDWSVGDEDEDEDSESGPGTAWGL